MKKEAFKFVIREFQDRELPDVRSRKLEIPEIEKVISIIGIRRSGKTYYFFQLIKDLLKNVSKDRIIYINLADDRLFPLKLDDLQDILEAYFELYPQNREQSLFLFLDEIQEAPHWELFVRRVYDQHNIRIYVTGSSSKIMHKEIHTALRGRTLNYEMFPLSFSEVLDFKNIHFPQDVQYSGQRHVIKNVCESYLFSGGFPETVIYENQHQKILENYLELIIYKDIVERYNIRNLALIKNLVKFLLTNVANSFSINSYFNVIKKNLTVKKSTISEYLSYLVDSHLIFTLPMFSYSLKQQQLNPKKVYCIDNGLRNTVAFTFSKDEGRLAENAVFLELRRRAKQLFYWKNKGEVDFIVKNRDHSLSAINVTFTDEVDEREIRALHAFRAKFHETRKCFVITRDLRKEDDGIQFIPLWMFLLNGNFDLDK